MYKQAVEQPRGHHRPCETPYQSTLDAVHGYFAHKKPPPSDPTVGLCVGT